MWGHRDVAKDRVDRGVALEYVTTDDSVTFDLLLSLMRDVEDDKGWDKLSRIYGALWERIGG